MTGTFDPLQKSREALPMKCRAIPFFLPTHLLILGLIILVHTLHSVLFRRRKRAKRQRLGSTPNLCSPEHEAEEDVLCGRTGDRVLIKKIDIVRNTGETTGEGRCLVLSRNLLLLGDKAEMQRSMINKDTSFTKQITKIRERADDCTLLPAPETRCRGLDPTHPQRSVQESILSPDVDDSEKLQMTHAPGHKSDFPDRGCGPAGDKSLSIVPIRAADGSDLPYRDQGLDDLLENVLLLIPKKHMSERLTRF